MNVKQILFNTEMVRAILDGRKTCTRRVIKPQPYGKCTYPLGFVTDSTEKKEVGCFGFGVDECGGSIQYAKPSYQPGDILYVRETWKNAPNGYYYYEDWQRNDIADVTKWKPSIHMPKEAARIWLEVTNVRVERLQDITIENALKEGVDIREIPTAINVNRVIGNLNAEADISCENFDKYAREVAICKNENTFSAGLIRAVEIIRECESDGNG